MHLWPTGNLNEFSLKSNQFTENNSTILLQKNPSPTGSVYPNPLNLSNSGPQVGKALRYNCYVSNWYIRIFTLTAPIPDYSCQLNWLSENRWTSRKISSRTQRIHSCTGSDVSRSGRGVSRPTWNWLKSDGVKLDVDWRLLRVEVFHNWCVLCSWGCS